MRIFNVGGVFCGLLLFLNFILIFIIRDVVLRGNLLLVRLLLFRLCCWRRSNTIQLVELSLILGPEKCKMVLHTVVVNPIELSNSRVGRNHLSISEEPPNLSESHGEGSFTLVGLDLSGVDSVPVLELRVVAKQDVLNFFESVV